MMTPETNKAIKNGLAWLARTQNADGSFGSGTYRGNIAVTSVAGLAFMASGSSPGRGPYGAQIDKALSVCDGEHVPLGFHLGGFRLDPWANVFARVRHVVSGRSVRDHSSAGDPREVAEGRPADHRQPEQRRGLAISTGEERCGYLGDNLPDQRVAGGSERRSGRTEGYDQRLHALCEAVAECRRRFSLYAPGRRQCVSEIGCRSGRASECWRS